MRSQQPRKSTRLKSYDYAQPGAYFVTICTHQREHLFGYITADEMRLNPAGEIVNAQWKALSDHYPHAAVDSFVVMPNHTHAVIMIFSAHPNGLTEIVRGLKTFSSRQINHLRKTQGVPVWQRSFHDHVIRDEYSRQYIIYNPALWEKDQFYGG